MANTYRALTEYFFGTLSVGLAAADVTIQGSAIANLPIVTPGSGPSGASPYVPLVLQNSATGVSEVVWVTTHTTGSTSATISRGMEGSTAQVWPANSLFACAPTTFDFPALGTLSTFDSVTIGHVAKRMIDGTTGRIFEKTQLAAWQSPAYAPPDGNGPGQGGSATPSNAAMIIESGGFSGTSDSGGQISATFGKAFPNGIVVVLIVANNLANAAMCAKANTQTTTGFNCKFFLTTGAAAASQSVSGYYIAIGY
jgi:hypothetical protein